MTAESDALAQLRARNGKQSKAGVKGGLIGLAALVGVGVAQALFTAMPANESSRVVKVTMAPDGTPTIANIRGKQYLRVYLDMVGVKTACDGLTTDANGEPLRLGETFTEAECTAMLQTALIRTAAKVMGCTPGLATAANPALEKPREGPRFAAVSGAYNFGAGAYCKSTARARFNRFDYGGGCTALTRFDRAGGHVVKALHDRRMREYRVCTKGLGEL